MFPSTFRAGASRYGRAVSLALVLALWLPGLAIAGRVSSQAAATAIDNSVHPDDNVASRLNRTQLSTLRNQALAAVGGDAVQIVVFRNDGGDPGRIKPGDPANFVYALSRGGEEHVFQNGREVEVRPAIREAVKQIATAHLRATVAADGTAVAQVAGAQEVLKAFRGGSARPVRVHIVSRDDAARISEVYARKVLAIEAQTRGGTDRAGMVELVKTVMRMYGLKSDVCDHSSDARCNRPGVREAFAEIKRQEAAHQVAAAPPKRG